MNSGELRRGHEHLLRTVLRLRPARLWAVLEDHRAGYPSGSDDAPVSGGDTSSATERAALNRDQARDAQHRYRKALRKAVDAVDELAALERFWCDTNTEGRFGTAQCANIHCRELVQLDHKQVTDPHPVRCRPCQKYYDGHGFTDAPYDAVRKRRQPRPYQPAET